ncbi:DUF6099 family protein [Streptomyces sp. NPDC058695]|uniref:DUF6099 family protein n=1 Tax=Streptomyces sp. NPDC058695 TaxID=3346604 RepID=UPI0036610DF4
MDAVRLIRASRRALAESQDAPAITREAWQAQALAQAMGNRLAREGPPELRGEARGLSEAGGRGCSGSALPVIGAGGIRAAQLTELPEAHRALIGLAALLGEVGIALVGIASEAEEEGDYWHCMDAIDAADESRDRVLEIIRRLGLRRDTMSESEPDSAA